MLFSLILFLIFFNIFKIDLSEHLEGTVRFFHGLCLKMVPASPYFEVYEAIGCGKRISSLGLRQILVTTGLVHIFVVSGTHLSFIRNLLGKLKLPTFVEILVLAFYSMATSLNPPVVRAFLSYLLNKVSSRFALNWDKSTLCFHVSFLCLILFYSWFDSFSFMLSWAAALGVSFSTRRKNILAKNTIIYLVMLPILANISTPHPTVILINSVFLPIFGAILFPLTLLTIIFNFIAPLVDFVWEIFLFLLSFLSDQIPLFKSNPNFSNFTMFLYLLSLHMVYLIIKIRAHILR